MLAGDPGPQSSLFLTESLSVVKLILHGEDWPDSSRATPTPQITNIKLVHPLPPPPHIPLPIHPSSDVVPLIVFVNS